MNDKNAIAHMITTLDESYVILAKGLSDPSVYDADRKTLVNILALFKGLSDKARQLAADEQAHKPTEYYSGICRCEHRYADGGCHQKCPQCNPDNIPCPIDKEQARKDTAPASLLADLQALDNLVCYKMQDWDGMDICKMPTTAQGYRDIFVMVDRIKEKYAYLANTPTTTQEPIAKVDGLPDKGKRK